MPQLKIPRTILSSKTGDKDGKVTHKTRPATTLLVQPFFKINPVELLDETTTINWRPSHGESFGIPSV